MLLFTPYNGPYLFAISFILLIGLLEIISLLCGHLLSGAFDAHLDHYDALSEGNIGQVLHYLNIGRLPRACGTLFTGRVLWTVRHTRTARLGYVLANSPEQSPAGTD